MSAPDFPAGRIVGGAYTVQSRLGGTPWATTYGGLAVPNRDVAIKVFTAEIGNRSEVRRALEHADEQSRTVPEHFAIHAESVGRDAETAQLYRISSLSAHPSLAQLTELCALSVDETDRFVHSLAIAIQAAHNAGVSHGALKPTNVFVGPGPDYAVKLADFGAAACLLASKMKRKPGGPESWLAPEQRTDPLVATPACDVFSLALVAFFALTKSALAGPKPKDGEALPRAVARARELGVFLPPALDDVFERALATAPDVRFGSAAEFAGAFASAARASAPISITKARPIEIADEPADAMPISERVVATLSPYAKYKRALTYAAIGSVVLAGTGGVIVAKIVTSEPDDAPETKRSQPTPPAASTVALTVPSPSNVSTPSPSSVPVPVPEPEPVPSTAPPTSDLGRQAELTIECEPACEIVKVDGRAVKSWTAIRMKPGLYGIGASTRGHFGNWQRIRLGAGERRTLKFRLQPDPRARR